jgi:hypothetical protein
MNRRCTLLALVLLLPAAAWAQQTARAALNQALTAARAWQPDAALTSVSATGATADGKAKNWSYLFFSPQTNKAWSANYAGTKQVHASEVRPHMRDPIGNEFVDSDKATTVARANGIDTKGQPLVLTLLLVGKATKAPIVAWTVGGGFSKGSVSVVVDARTGRFAYKQQVE